MNVVPEGSWVDEARGHPRKLFGLVVGLALLATGNWVLLWPGIVLSGLAVGQLVTYWGDETDASVDRRAV
ncbi:unknown (plasmid) [Haloarcula marismortui ATCC 43049]|uniref:Uncharacterized protein n=1 Tax=Haloarcula marismortui (strain ATCC 43049 / DSM 3752 / JCM 8966 / VKM B-1809) TaxID=272569 RepID=Q5V870_HALMA|nr:hypothetical protein [Haloarcula marismortui]AAV44271.1 unknown [Haloarcula marismortui ATCC 43049]QCP89420.1 hypothetical protein E6P14_00360 [Haloarcula marismortui ATCC 43049]